MATKALLPLVQHLGVVFLVHDLGIQEGVVHAEEVEDIVPCQLNNEGHSGMFCVGLTIQLIVDLVNAHHGGGHVFWFSAPQPVEFRS